MIFYLQSLICTIHYFIYCFVGNISNRRLERAFVFFKNGFNLPKNSTTFMFSKGCNTSLIDTEFFVRNNLVHVNLVHKSKSLTTWTGTVRRVERKIVRSWFVVRNTTGRAHQHFTEETRFIRVFFQQHNNAISLLHGFLHRFLETLAVFFAHFQFVNNHFDIMVFISVEF